MKIINKLTMSYGWFVDQMMKLRRSEVCFIDGVTPKQVTNWCIAHINKGKQLKMLIAPKRHLLIGLFFFATLLGFSMKASAVTINLVAETGGYVCYRIGDSGDYTTYAQSYTIEASVGAKVYIFAHPGSTGYSYSSLTASSGLTLTDTSNPRNKYFTVAAGHNGKTITATYTLKSYTLTLTSGAGGSVSGSSGLISYTTPCTVTATANSGYMFVSWTDDRNGEVVSNCPVYSFPMPANNWSLTANFITTPTAATSIDGYYYFDLAAGDVIISSSYFMGYRYDGTSTPQLVVGTHTENNKYYIYQSQKTSSSGTGTGSYYSNTGYYDGSMHLPNYDEVRVTVDGVSKTWSEYITNNNDVNQVIDKWNEVIPTYNKEATLNKIHVEGNSTYDVTIDGVCSKYFYIAPNADPETNYYPEAHKHGSFEVNMDMGGNTTVRLKGDNRLLNLCYICQTPETGHLYITSADGDGETVGSLTTTDFEYDDVPGGINDPENPNHEGNRPGKHPESMSVLGSPSQYPEYGLTFLGGTIFAGCPDEYRGVWPGRNIEYPVCVGGGGNSFGQITIEGGTITAVSNAPGPAIGGGAGYLSLGGAAEVNISGGIVYAYSYGIFSTEEGYEGFVPSTAIGGSSTFHVEAVDGTVVNITGGYVYSESMGGVAIGGGSARASTGGNAIVNISENAEVHAKSTSGTRTIYKAVDGVVTTFDYNIVAGNAIGGGNGIAGGEATVNIGGNCTIDATSIGGGHAINGVNEVAQSGGYAELNITGGTSEIEGNIGGGNTNGEGDGGDATITISGGSLTSGTIGGGSAISGKGGDSSIKITGGLLDCASVGGGHSVSGTPGAVTSATEEAGVLITGGTVKSGTIGGGYNDNGAIGFATAKVSGTNTFVQGQFLLASTDPSKRCFFKMLSGTFDNVGMVEGTKYIRAKDEGGAVYMEDPNGQVIISGGVIKNATGTQGGAIYMTNGSFTMSGGTIGGETIATGNKATLNGGALYMAGGSFEMTGGSIKCNKALNNDGGGLYLNSGTVKVSGAEAVICGNEAKVHGGGIYVGGGSFTMTGGAIGGTTTEGNKTTGNTSYGGGLYMGGGTATISGGTISGNHTDNDGMGGGIYMDGGTCTLSGGATIGGASASYANSARHGGGIYSRNGSITVKGGIIDHNTAVDGGGIYSNGPDATVTIIKEGTTPSLLEYNQAVRGGGIFANRGVVDFTDGQVRQNYASEGGGGMYVNTEGTLNLKGNATLSGNHVPATGKGGGVYLDGTLNVGENAGDPADRHSLKVDDNYAGTPSTLNNVYLHDMDDVVTLLSDISGKDSGGNYHSHIGFSVDMGFRPVIYAATANIAWLTSLMGTGSALAGAIFDDSQKYIAIHVNEDSAPFENEYIYLWACWTTAVTSDPGTAAIELVGDTYHIKSKEGLAWFVSLVNGLNHREDDEGHTEAGSNPFTEDKPTLKGVLEADVDMHEFLWVPIGGVGSYNAFDPSSMSSIFTAGGSYEGTFDGRGHTISGLDCRYITAINSYGLFGNLKEAASVSNTFVKDYYFEAQDNSITYNIGGIAGTMGDDASIANCEAKGTVTATRCGTASTVGGLVGKMDGTSEIHSSIGIPDVAAGAAARHVGGIAGEVLASGNAIRNSFANASFGATADTVGGLVGKNSGLVENCYARLRGAAPGNFGYLVGDNTNGTVKYSYATLTDYTISGKEGTLEGHGTYGITQLPYLYKHRDTQVAATNDYVPTDASADKQLMIVLNKWVEAPAQASGNYTKWGRPWQESDAQKPLNDDYPILKMPVGEAVAAESTDPYLYYGTVDNLLTKYNAAGDAIWMYRNSESVTGDNSTSAAKLYIAEDVVLLNDNPLKAYVGITLDNSAGADGAYPTYFPGVPDATDWHMIATPLSDAPIGINYDNGTYDFDYGHPSGMPYYRFYPKDDAKHGYFPSHRFGKSYPGDDDTIEEGSYYNEWDFYSYYEPEYHWINFKRNSASHHHMEADGHDAIEYHNGDPLLADDLGNESRLVPGKGYFAATREETFLQCQGHLNADEVTIGLTHTPNIPRHGYNLIGNPYQAYLDFDAFADANWGDDGENIWGEGETPSYTILDEDQLDLTDSVETVMGRKPVFYKTFSYDCSSNPDVSAGGFIHPHQGFFVRLGEDRTGATASFEPAQRNATDTVTSKFRGNDHIDYPLVNLFAIEENGAADVVTVELGRPDEGGAALMQSLRVGNGKIWCHYDDKDYAIAYTQPGISEVAIRFESVKDTEYTMRWSTRNGEFSYLHLIDNVTGADVDCLTTDEYKFSASTSDYKSRFRLVFGYTGIEEDTEAEANENFAFMMNDALVVTGEGVLQVFDVNGRMVAQQELHGVQTTMALPNAANGVYVLRLTEGKQSRMQKMVISK